MGDIERGEHCPDLAIAQHLTEAARVRIAVLAHGGVADRSSAAWWHGLLDELPTPVTALPLTVLAAASELDDGIAIMDRALQQRRVHLTDLRRSLDRNAGSFGMQRARMLLEAAEDPSESVAERKFVKLLPA